MNPKPLNHTFILIQNSIYFKGHNSEIAGKGPISGVVHCSHMYC